MTRREKFSAALYLVSIVAAAIFAVLTLCKCGPGADPAQTAVRTAIYAMEALCAPSATVQECADSMKERVQYLEWDGGARE